MGWCDQIADPAVARTVTRVICYPLGLVISEMVRLGCDHTLETVPQCPALFTDPRVSTMCGLVLATLAVAQFSKAMSVSLWTSREHLNRVSLSLNILASPVDDSPGGVGSGQVRSLQLRTLWEKQLEEIIPDKGGRAIFRKTALRSNAEQKSYPFLEDTETNHDLVINYFVNAISSICDTNFVSSELGQPVVERAFVFGLTFEQLTEKQQQEAHVRKVRVLLMREDRLKEISELTLEKHGGSVQLQSKRSFHEDRFTHLQKMARRWRQEKLKNRRRVAPTGKPRIYLGTVRLCVPELQQLHWDMQQLRSALAELQQQNSPRPQLASTSIGGLRYSRSMVSLNSPPPTPNGDPPTVGGGGGDLLPPRQARPDHEEVMAGGAVESPQATSEAQRQQVQESRDTEAEAVGLAAGEESEAEVDSDVIETEVTVVDVLDRHPDMRRRRASAKAAAKAAAVAAAARTTST
jgi:hypothetical protein